YIKLFSSKDNGKNNIIKHFLECFAILIQYEAGDLYRQKYGRNFDRYKKDQCPQRDNKCFKHNCAVPARIMLNLFNDSRVYLYTPDMDDKVNNLMSRNTIRTLVENWQQDNYHLHGQSDQNMSNDKILEKYFPYNWINNIDNIKSEPHVQEALLDKDPIYLMSKLWRTNKTYRETKNDHKSVEDRLNSDMTHAKNVKIGFVKDTNDKLDQKVKVAVSKIKKYYELGNGNTKRIKDIYFESDTEENINTHWDKNGWRWTISDLCKLIHPEYVRKQTDSIEFYYPKNLLAGAFHHLKVDIDNHFTVVSITAGEIKGNDLLLDGKKYQQYLCYMLFEYNSKKKGEPHKFVDINWNPIGRAILNGYWFNKNSGINKHPFPKHHFNCCTLANDIINFDYNNGLYNLNIKSEEAWLFTFKSIKNTSTRKIL
ncbi:MAG: hypothetical protein PHW73_14490, partial [Atribacterota bacterium]|nr:hypothetical protein [Atribacterota bacterium]